MDNGNLDTVDLEAEHDRDPLGQPLDVASLSAIDGDGELRPCLGKSLVPLGLDSHQTGKLVSTP